MLQFNFLDNIIGLSFGWEDPIFAHMQFSAKVISFFTSLVNTWHEEGNEKKNFAFLWFSFIDTRTIDHSFLGIPLHGYSEQS